ncbi:uncharacterized protein LOC142224820 [Haematobia irritans]|uniref:uncharacterized protein LOC142224820 n=1 Tax=Haematobia irritans TaxID=7368 RepID=UPI003F4F56AD
METHNAQISGLGGTVVSSCKGKYILTVKAPKSDFKIIIKALVVSSLAHLLPSRPIKTTFLNEVKGPADSEKVNAFSTTVSASEALVLHKQLKKFWELEEVEKPQAESDTDTWCENFYKSTTYRQHDGRYVVRLPFKQEYPHEIFPGSSRHMAFAQYVRMEKNLRKTPELKQEYDKVLREYEELSHMTLVNTNEENGDHVPNYFLPHHAVVRPESMSTKVRVVFNASKKTSSGHSLNDVLHSGPILQQDLVKVLRNWRYYQFVFNGDIQKMYRQICVHDDDQKFEQILFRPAPNKPVQNFRLQTVTFGVNAAPFLAIRPLLELSKDCQPLYPKASQILQHEVYVDDVLSGAHSIAGAKVKQDQLVKALSSDGFPLKKLTSNSKALLQLWPREDLLDEEFLNIEDHSLGWDDDAPPPILKRWSSFAENLQKVSDVRIQRWIQFSPRASVQFHGFSDASEMAYCAAVSPYKEDYYPKLELCGAELLSRFIQQVIKDVDFEYELFLWRDSSIVLSWLQKSPQTLKTFVANRVSDILNVVNVGHWNYVKTDENLADLGSRGCAPQDLSSSQLWWHGPS